MKKASKKQIEEVTVDAVTVNEAIESQDAIITEEPIVDEVIAEVKQLGRKINPDSVRQQRLAEMEAKRVNGELKRGRPINGESERQKRLAELEAKRANGELKRGRPVNGESERQKRLAEMNAKRELGTLKRGRPAMVKVTTEPVVETPIVDETSVGEVA